MPSNLFFRQKKRKPKFFKKIFRVFLYFFAALFFFCAGTFFYFAKDLPNPQKINERQIIQSTKIFDRTGTVLLYDIHEEEKRTLVTLDQISKYLQQATIATEDANFYHHFGLDFKGIARAILGVITGNRSAGGGSTITQQFIKKSMLSDARSYSRKIKEWILALELEAKYSKDEILTFYLNQIPYGSNAYGIEAAAQTFFGKPAKNLNLAESALLAALPQAPSRLSPFGSHPEELKARQEYILDRMALLGYISKEEAEKAKKEPLNYATQDRGIKAPHFVMYIKEYLEEKYGEDVLKKGGLKVFTTLDWELQQTAEKIIYEGAKANWQKYRARNASLVAIDPKTGQILAMVGSYDYFDIANDGNVNVAIRDRQPGSSFKPFAYVTAFQKGYTPETILFDLKTEFNPYCSPTADQGKDQYGSNCYHPGNYDDLFRGPVTAREALAQSLNIPSVKILYLAGIPETIKTAKKMGITTLNDPQRFGLALVLGGGEVKLLDEVAAYSVFANDGIKNEKTAILKIEDAQGNVLEEFKKQPQRVLEENLARQISSILSDNEARKPVFGPNSYLYFPERKVAAKTGTTQNYRDAWTVGYTPSLAVGVWVGNNDNSSMSKAGAGIAAAGPLWHNFLKQAYELKNKNCPKDKTNVFCLPSEPEEFPSLQKINTKKPCLNGEFLVQRKIKINKLTGQIVEEQTPAEFVEEKTFYEIHNILYYVQKDNPLSDSTITSKDDPQFNNWEYPVILWAQKNFGQKINQPLPDNQNYDPANLPQVNIISPAANQIITNDFFVFEVQPQAPNGLKQVDYFLDNEFIGSTFISPHRILVSLKDIRKEIITIKARVYDNFLNFQEKEQKIIINRQN